MQQRHEKQYFYIQSNYLGIFLRESTGALLCQNNTPCSSANARGVEAGDGNASCLLQWICIFKTAKSARPWTKFNPRKPPQNKGRLVLLWSVAHFELPWSFTGNSTLEGAGGRDWGCLCQSVTEREVGTSQLHPTKAIWRVNTVEEILRCSCSLRGLQYLQKIRYGSFTKWLCLI